MEEDTFRHPVDLITVGLQADQPDRNLQNDDVAFILATRFNVRMNIAKRNRWSHLEGRHFSESPEYDVYWRRRLDIFERVCIPSVLNLTPRPDAWFIAFGDVEPDYIQELLERLSIYPWIHPYIRKEGKRGSDKPLNELLIAHVRSLGKQFLCSTRFDSDDSLHQQFTGALDRAISQLRERGFDDDTRCLNVMYGLMQSAGELSVHLRRTNMFESFFEPVERVRGPYQVPHDEVRKQMPLVEVITNLPMWIYHRHEDTLEPAWVTDRDRLLLSNPDQYYPLFGLDPESVVGLQTRSEMSADSPGNRVERKPDDPRPDAAGLQASRYWRQDQHATAIELATVRKQPELARWLASTAGNELDCVQVLREIEDASLTFMNGAQLARLARSLSDQGENVRALRAYDYAVQLAPSDWHIRNARDELASVWLSESDLDEQMELASFDRFEPDSTNNVVIVASAPTPDSQGMEIDQLRDRAGRLTQAGFTAYVLSLPGPGQGKIDAHQPGYSRDGVNYEYLRLSTPCPAGADALRRANTRLLAERVSALHPCLLVTDGTVVAQAIAASIGRAFAIPVDFSVEPAATGQASS